MENQNYAAGVNSLVLNLQEEGRARWIYLFNPGNPDEMSWKIRLEQWYPITGGRIIVQDYMGEFVVLEVIERGKRLNISSPVAGFSGYFEGISEELFQERFGNRINASP